MTQIMEQAIVGLLTDFLSNEQIEASRKIMGLDTQLISDQTYFVVEEHGNVIGCGGWSRRATLFGGDHSVELRIPRLLDPDREAARVRAMYTLPAHARRGVGRLLLNASEEAARAEGFRAVELMATLSGEPLYRACGYNVIKGEEVQVGSVSVPLLRMGRAI